MTTIPKDNPPYDGEDDFRKSLELAYKTIRERKLNGGPGWNQKPSIMGPFNNPSRIRHG